jgi:glycosyltransferase involved in cell wall biosynthesis
MITPFAEVQRGNSLTTARLQTFLKARGFNIDRFSLEHSDWSKRLHLLLEANNYTIVHGFHAYYFGHVLQAIPNLRTLPLILTATGTDINLDLHGRNRAAVLDAMQAAHKIAVFNDDFHRDILTHYPAGKQKLVTIPQGVYLESGPKKTREDLGIGSNKIVFLLPSGLRPVKNIDLAIQALSVLQTDYPQIHLLIIGPVIEKEYGLLLLERIEKITWISYLGEVPHAEMGSLLALGDVVLNTSFSEGQPQAALEAMSLGIPCILSAVPGNLNVITSGHEGFYVQDKNELAAAAKLLLEQPQLRIKMGENARRLINRQFNLERELNDYSHLYQAIQDDFHFKPDTALTLS